MGQVGHSGGERQDGSKVDASKFEKEQYKVESLLRLLGYSIFSTSRPDPDQKNETGVDVLVKLDGRRIGFQVTDFHSDEGEGSEHKGSDLRREERKKAVDGLPAAMFVNPNPMAGLIYRIEDKSKKQWSTKDFPEMILLIAASITEVPGIVSTFSLDACLDVNEMNAQLCPILKRTRYSAAYLYNMIQQSVYQWTIQESWEKIL